jgi:polyisoprenoid-binding protein YceI
MNARVTGLVVTAALFASGTFISTASSEQPAREPTPTPAAPAQPSTPTAQPTTAPVTAPAATPAPTPTAAPAAAPKATPAVAPAAPGAPSAPGRPAPVPQPPLKDATNVQPAPATAASGKSLDVPADHAAAGKVFHALPGKARQVSFRWAGIKEDPDKSQEGVSNGVVGYAVVGSDDAPFALKGGWWKLPVKSLDTQIPLRNEHLQGADWLDAEKNPYITFQLLEVIDVDMRPARDGVPVKAATGSLRGNITIRGVSREITIPQAQLSLTEAGAATSTYGKGNLLTIRRRDIQVPLAQFGVKNDAISKAAKVAEVVRFDLSLIMSDEVEDTLTPAKPMPVPATLPNTPATPATPK